MPHMMEILTHEALAPLRHGFFTRKGGASSGIFKGLNCGAGSSDQTEAVQMNRARVAQVMEVPPDRLLGVHQVHSPDVVTVTAPVPPGLRADALVTRKDPMDFMRRLAFYRSAGAGLFTA